MLIAELLVVWGVHEKLRTVHRCEDYGFEADEALPNVWCCADKKGRVLLGERAAAG